MAWRVLALAAASGLIAWQPAATGSIAGSVVDASGQALAGAIVRVADPKTGFEAAVTSVNGQFQFNTLAPARYALSAAIEGYSPAEYGAFQPGDPGVPIRVVARQRVSNLIITLRKAGAISGRLIDDQGDSTAGHVSILVPGPGMKTVTAGSTDGEGRYRFGNLAPGPYAVLAVPDSSSRERRVKDASGVDRVVMLTPTFYPSTTTFAGALVVTVGSDDEARADIQVRAEPATSVELSLASAGGRPLDRVQAVLISDDERGPAKLQWAQDPDASAKATISGVIAGQYRLVVSGFERFSTASARPDARELAAMLDQAVTTGPEWAVRHLFVDGRTVVAVPVLLESGAVLDCRARFEGDQPPDQTTRTVMGPQTRMVVGSGGVALRMKPLDGDLPRGLEPGPEVLSLAGAGASTYRGIAPGRYLLQVNESRGGSMNSIKDARINGVDVLDLPVELRGGETTAVSLTVTDRQSEVTGTVTGADGRPRLDLAVVVFPADSRYWLRGTRRIVVTRPDTSGIYEFRGLPGGEYLVATIAERPPEDLSDAQWLSTLASTAAKLAVVGGQRHVLDLTAAR